MNPLTKTYIAIGLVVLALFEFFAAMDLSRRGLSKLRRAVERGDEVKARAELVEYFRTRKTPKWFFD